ncbi:MAG: hypothetical protein ACR2PI_18815 [Hyphomicrobiaceae bacterium]
MRYAEAIERFRALARPIVDDAIDALTGGRHRCDGIARAQHAYKRVAAKESCPGVRRIASVSMTFAELTRELGNAPDIKKLRGLRRRFAFGRHPDRVMNADRGQATAEMQMANDLIDQAIRQSLVDAAG